MILLYGAGGGPGRGEIPMDPIRYRASDAFLFCTWGFEEKLSAATKAQRQTGIGRALRFGGSYTRFKSDPKGGKMKCSDQSAKTDRDRESVALWRILYKIQS